MTNRLHATPSTLHYRRPSKGRQPWWLPVVCALFLVAFGCRSPVGVNKVGYEKVYRELTANALNEGEPSEMSEKLLEFLDLKEQFEESPDDALRALHTRFSFEGRRLGLFVLAELSYLAAVRTGHREQFLAAAVYAYLYFFDEQDSVPADPFSPAYREACDVYNRALARALLGADGNSLDLEPGTHDLPTGQLVLESTRPGFPWSPDLFSRFLPSDQYSVRGLSLRVRESGLGVPVIGVPNREVASPGSMIHALTEDVPATVFLRVQGGMREMSAGELKGTLEMYSSFDCTDVRVGDQRVPLESDLTTPLAHSLEKSRIWSFDLGSLFGGEVAGYDPGIYMVQPYSPGKIPIVFVHGTASSPTTWVEMFNWLRADRELRKRYQFWFFLYPSGSPIAYSGMIFRQALRDAIHTVDPTGADPALQDMIVVGHSQGGLLAKLAVVDSGDHFWNAITDKPFDAFKMGAEQTKTVRDSLFFERLPFVKHVIFISTPHAGSFLAANWIGRITQWFVNVPGKVRDTFAGTKDSPGIPPELAKGIPTSLDNMSAGNKFLSVLKTLPIVPGVRVNSIVTVDGEGDPEGLDDGVVSYASQHQPEAESEIVVRAFHTCLSNPRVIDEVRRILLGSLKPPDGE